MKVEAHLLPAFKNIAITTSPLGDSLLFMILSHNFRRNGFTVTIFSNFLTALRPYFPQDNIQTIPEINTSVRTFDSFDLLIFLYHKHIPAELDKKDPRLFVLEDYQLFRKPIRPIPMADIMVTLCKEIFRLANVVKANGIKPLAGLEFRKHPHRVVIHPSASFPNKQWPSARFISLAHRLKKQNYEPVFVIAAAEKPQFSQIFNQGFAVIANSSIEDLPQLLYESGWFIGNDSGIGHLASNLGIPTITLVGRRGTGTRWRPGWAPGKVLVPRIPLLRWKWKVNYWKYFISVSRVMKSFIELTNTAGVKENLLYLTDDK